MNTWPARLSTSYISFHIRHTLRTFDFVSFRFLRFGAAAAVGVEMGVEPRGQGAELCVVPVATGVPVVGVVSRSEQVAPGVVANSGRAPIRGPSVSRSMLRERGLRSIS